MTTHAARDLSHGIRLLKSHEEIDEMVGRLGVQKVAMGQIKDALNESLATLKRVTNQKSKEKQLVERSRRTVNTLL